MYPLDYAKSLKDYLTNDHRVIMTGDLSRKGIDKQLFAPEPIY